MPNELDLEPEDERPVRLAELERRLGAAATALSLPQRLVGLLWSFLLPEKYKRPRPIGPPSKPCKAPAGSEERIRAYEKRAENRRSVFSKRDLQQAQLAQGINHGHRGHTEDEMVAAFRQQPTPDAPPCDSIDDLLADWTDILGRSPDSLARQVDTLRANLKEMATTVLQLREQLKRAKPKVKAPKTGTKVWHVSRGYRPPKEHPEIPFEASTLDTNDLVEEDETDVESPSWQVSNGRLCGVAS